MPSLRVLCCLIIFNMPGSAIANNQDVIPDQDFLILKTQLKQQALSSPLNIQQQYQLAVSYWRLGAFNDARSILKKLLKREPDHIEAHYLSGLVFLSLVGEVNIFRKLGMAKKSLESWNRVLTLNEQHVNARFAVFSFYLNAPGIAGGDLELAEQSLSELKTINYPYHQMASGLLLAKQGDKEAAEKRLVEASITIEHQATPLFQLAQFYLQQEQFIKASATLEAFLDQPRVWSDPSKNLIFFLMHLAELGQGNNEAAKKLLEHAIELTVRPAAKKRMTKALDEF